MKENRMTVVQCWDDGVTADVRLVDILRKHNARAFHPCCHFLAPDLWSRYETAKTGGVFYFWGHSYEMITEAMWTAFAEMIARISADPGARWGDVAALFDDARHNENVPNQPVASDA